VVVVPLSVILCCQEAHTTRRRCHRRHASWSTLSWRAKHYSACFVGLHSLVWSGLRATGPVLVTCPSVTVVRTLCAVQAFGVAKYGKAHRVVQRNLDRGHRKEHVPLAERTSTLAPPITVVVMGPKGVGKTTLIKARLSPPPPPLPTHIHTRLPLPVHAIGRRQCIVLWAAVA
jgi:hypothetical protein